MKTITFRTLSLALLFMLLFFSCKDDTSSTKLLKQAQELADTQPKKALELLDSIQNPQKMDEESYMKYIIARTQAKYNSKQDISEDTLMIQAKYYFENKNNPRESALANFYLGHIYYENSITEKALEHFLKAASLAKLDNDNILMGRSLNNIGYNYYKQELLDSAIVYYQLALNIYEGEKKAESLKMSTLRAIGLVYYAIHNLEQSDNFFNKGLSIAQQVNSKQYQNKFVHDLGTVYREQGKYKQASENLHTALNQTESSVDSLRIYLNLAQLYNYMNRTDSTRYYTDRMRNRLAEITDIYMLKNIYASFSEYNRQEGNYSEALRYADLEREIRQQIKEENKALQLLEANKKVILEQKDREIQRQKTENYWCLAGGLLFAILFMLLTTYWLVDLRKDSKKLQAEIDRIKGIRNLSQDLKFIKWATDILNSDPLGSKVILLLKSNKDIQLVALSMNGYPKEVIAAMLNIPSQEVEVRKAKIRQLLIEAGYANKQIDDILKI